MPDPISLAAGYFLLKTAVSMGMAIKEGTSAENIGDELFKAAGGNFYYDLLKSGVLFGSKTAWNGIASRMRSEYNSDQPLNHDLQKAIRKSQIEATLSACESCFDNLKLQDSTFLDKLKNRLSLNEDERWLKNVVQSLTKNLAEIKDKDSIPPTITNDIDVLKIADDRNYPLTDESVQNLVNSIKKQTILEVRFANPPNFSQKQIASQLEDKIYNGWTKEFQGEPILVDWYKLLCDRFNEEYKENSKVNAALQKAFFQDLKSESTLAKKFSDFSENHFEKLGDQILSKLDIIAGKQDSLLKFVETFKDENDKKLTEALKILRTSVSEINTFTERKAEETQDVAIQVGDKVIEANKSESEKIIQHLDKKFASQSEEIHHKFEEALQKTANFRRNILAKRDLTIIEKLFGNRRFDSFDRIFGKLTPQEEFFVSLKKRYTERYFNKLDGRFEITLMASDDLESEVKRQYTGIYEGQGQLNEAFEYMRNAFQDANRLLIIGEPGVGKTVLLLKFANDLSDKIVEKLNNRPEIKLDDIKDPIPAIFNLATWSEDYPSFKDWLIAMLKTGEGLSELFADELLSNKKIFLLLDGLDELAKNEVPEIAAEIREKCFNSIVGFLRGGQKAVICCRVDEYWQIRKNIGQEDEEQRRNMPEVLVKNLDINQIGDALQRASQTEVDRESAHNILELLKTKNSGILLKVLSVPFYFTTALEIFDSSIMKERNIPVDEQELKNYLIEKLIAGKLDISLPSPKKLKYKKSVKWLKWLALLLKKKNKVSFELADLQQSDLKKNLKYIILFSLIVAFYFSISSWGLLLLMGFGLLLFLKKLDFSLSDFFSINFYKRFVKFSLIGILIHSYPIYIFVFIFIPILTLFALLFGESNFYIELQKSLYGGWVGFIFVLFVNITPILIKSIFTGIWGSLIKISDFKTEGIIEWKVNNLVNWNSWQKIFIQSAIYTAVGIVIGLIIAFMAETAKTLTFSQIDRIFINHDEEKKLIVNFAEALFNLSVKFEDFWVFVIVAIIISFALNVKNSCQQIKQFAFTRTSYQRLKGGIFYNILDWTILFLAIVLLDIPYRIYQARNDFSLLLQMFFFLFLVIIPLGIVWGLIGGFLFSSLGNHLLLRVCFFIERVMPIRYVTFLNYQAKARILEKDGGFWRFRHQELQDYFAKLP